MKKKKCCTANGVVVSNLINDAVKEYIRICCDKVLGRYKTVLRFCFIFSQFTLTQQPTAVE